MTRMWKTVILTVGASALVSCGQSAEYSDDQLDPTVVDANHYKVEFENDQVRVLRIKYGPGGESVMHFHPDNVAVFLNDLHAEFEKPDGSKQEVRMNAGQQVWASAGQHLPRSLGSAPIEVVLVELKPGASAGEGRKGPDPVLVDAANYNAEFENERVRILRIRYTEGQSSLPHWHPNSVAVFLTDQHASFVDFDGNSEEIHVDSGRHMFLPAGNHTPTNIGDEPFELILVELKGA